MKPTTAKIKQVIGSNVDSKKIRSVFISSNDMNQKQEFDLFFNEAKKHLSQKKDFYLVLVEQKS